LTNEVIRTAAAFRSFRPSKLATYTLPVTVATEHPLGDVLLLKQPDATGVVDRFLGRTPAPTLGATSPANTQVSVLNALGTSGLAAATADDLRRSGYRIATVGNAPSADLARSQVAYAPGALADAKALASTLVGGATLVEDPTLAPTRLTLILGPGFTGVRPLPGAGSKSAPQGSSKGGSSSGTTKPKPSKPVPDLRPYDPRPC
jgi:hypothetical protein